MVPGVSAQQNFCPQCGLPRQGALRFCANCGFDYWKAADPAAQPAAASGGTPPAGPSQWGQTTAPAAPAKKRSRIGCIALVVIALIVIAVIASQGNKPGGAADATSTPTLSSSATALPSKSVAPTAKPTPSAPPTPAFAPIKLSGTGSSVPRFTIPVDTPAIADISHVGAANFAVWALGESGEKQDLLVNTIGNYTGTVLFDQKTGEHSVAMDVQADGAWTIEIKSLTAAFKWDGKKALVGGGDDVAILNPASSGLKSVTITHQGEGNFAVWAYGPSTDLLVNTIGPGSEESLLPEGTLLLQITADGPWTVSPPK